MKKARSQKLKKFNKVLSVLLAAAMVAGSVPDVSLVAHATEAETEAAEETSFLSEENSDTEIADTADAVSESTSEEVSTAEEQQQPSEEAVPTEEEVSEEAVSTQEASSTEENKESEPTSDAVESESVDVSEDNTAGEEEVIADESIAPETGEESGGGSDDSEVQPPADTNAMTITKGDMESVSYAFLETSPERAYEINNPVEFGESSPTNTITIPEGNDKDLYILATAGKNVTKTTVKVGEGNAEKVNTVTDLAENQVVYKVASASIEKDSTITFEVDKAFTVTVDKPTTGVSKVQYRISETNITDVSSFKTSIPSDGKLTVTDEEKLFLYITADDYNDLKVTRSDVEAGDNDANVVTGTNGIYSIDATALTKDVTITITASGQTTVTVTGTNVQDTIQYKFAPTKPSSDWKNVENGKIVVKEEDLKTDEDLNNLYIKVEPETNYKITKAGGAALVEGNLDSSTGAYIHEIVNAKIKTTSSVAFETALAKLLVKTPDSAFTTINYAFANTKPTEITETLSSEYATIADGNNLYLQFTKSDAFTTADAVVIKDQTGNTVTYTGALSAPAETSKAGENTTILTATITKASLANVTELHISLKANDGTSAGVQKALTAQVKVNGTVNTASGVTVKEWKDNAESVAPSNIPMRTAFSFKLDGTDGLAAKHLKLDSVTFTVNGKTETVSASAEKVYTIAADKVTGPVTITVNLVSIKYKAKINATGATITQYTDDSNTVIEKGEDAFAATNFANGVDITEGKSFTFQFTADDTEKPIITKKVGTGEPVTLEAKADGATDYYEVGSTTNGKTTYTVTTEAAATGASRAATGITAETTYTITLEAKEAKTKFEYETINNVADVTDANINVDIEHTTKNDVTEDGYIGFGKNVNFKIIPKDKKMEVIAVTAKIKAKPTTETSAPAEEDVAAEKITFTAATDTTPATVTVNAEDFAGKASIKFTIKLAKKSNEVTFAEDPSTSGKVSIAKYTTKSNQADLTIPNDKTTTVGPTQAVDQDESMEIIFEVKQNGDVVPSTRSVLAAMSFHELQRAAAEGKVQLPKITRKDTPVSSGDTGSSRESEDENEYILPYEVTEMENGKPDCMYFKVNTGAISKATTITYVLDKEEKEDYVVTVAGEGEATGTVVITSPYDEMMVSTGRSVLVNRTQNLTFTLKRGKNLAGDRELTASVKRGAVNLNIKPDESGVYTIDKSLITDDITITVSSVTVDTAAVAILMKGVSKEAFAPASIKTDEGIEEAYLQYKVVGRDEYYKPVTETQIGRDLVLYKEAVVGKSFELRFRTGENYTISVAQGTGESATALSAEMDGLDTIYTIPVTDTKRIELTIKAADITPRAKICFDSSKVEVVSAFIGAKQIELKADGTEEETVTTTEDGKEVTTKKTYNVYNLESAEDTLTVTFKGKDGYLVKGANKTTNELTVNVKAGAKVDVETEESYTVIVKEGTNSIAPVNGKYSVGYTGSVKISLKNGSASPAVKAVAAKAGRTALTETEAKISGSDAEIVMDKKFAGKTITVDLSAEVTVKSTEEGKPDTKEIQKVATVTLVVNPELKGLTVAGVKNGALTQTAGTKQAYNITVNPKTASTKLYAESDKKASVDVKAEDGAIVIDAKAVAAPDSAKIKVWAGAPKFEDAAVSTEFTVSTVAGVTDKKTTAKVKYAHDTGFTLTLGTAKLPELTDGGYYYKVEAKKGTAAEGVTANDKTVYVPVTGDTQDAKIDGLVTKNKDGFGGVASFDITVTLVQAAKKGTAQAATLSNIVGENTAKAVKLAGISTKNPYYETTLKVKSGGTVYTGQKNAVIAIPQFGKDTTFTNTWKVKDISTTSVSSISTNNAVLNTNNQLVVDIPTGSGYVGKHTFKITAETVMEGAEEDTMYAASATVTVNVVRGIENLELSAPKTLYKGDSKKAVSYTVKPVFNHGYTAAKPKTAKVKDWKIVNTATGNTDPKVTISKSGKITVAKDYVVTDKSTFTVSATAADYVGNTRIAEATITITTQKLNIAQVVLAKYNGEKNGYDIITGGDVERNDIKYAEVYALKNVAPSSNFISYDDWDSYVLNDFPNRCAMTYKSSNAKALEVTSSGKIVVNKPANNVKITVTANDGSKSTKSMTLNVKYAAVEDLGIQFYKGSMDDDIKYATPNDTNVSFLGTTASRFGIAVVQYDSEGKAWVALDDFTDFKVTVKGAKLLKDEYNKTVFGDYGEKHQFATTGKTATVTLKYAGNTKTYTLTNTGFDAANKVGAPKVTLNPKSLKAGETLDIQATVGAVKGHTYAEEQLFAKVEVDETAVNAKNSDIYNSLRYNLAGEYQLNTIDAKGNSSINLYAFYGISVAGSYKLKLTVGTKNANGQFEPIAKAANVTIKVTKGATAPKELKLKMSLRDAGVVLPVRYSKVLNANIGGLPNAFRDYFDIDEDTNRLVLTQKAFAKDNKLTENLVGYLRYNSIDTKVTITLVDDATTKYTANTINLISGAVDINVPIYFGKNKVHVVAAKEDAGSALSAKVTLPTGETSVQSINLSGTVEKGSYKVKVWIVPADSNYVLAGQTQAEAAAKDPAAYGIPVVINVKVSDADTTRNKVKFSAAKYAFTMADQYVAAFQSGYNREIRNYWIDMSYTLPSANTKIKEVKNISEKDKEKLINVKYEESGVIRATVGTDALATLGYSAKKAVTYKVPVEITYANSTKTDTVNLTFVMPTAPVTDYNVAMDGLEAAQSAIEKSVVPQIGRAELADETVIGNYTESELNAVDQAVANLKSRIFAEIKDNADVLVETDAVAWDDKTGSYSATQTWLADANYYKQPEADELGKLVVRTKIYDMTQAVVDKDGKVTNKPVCTEMNFTLTIPRLAAQEDDLSTFVNRWVRDKELQVPVDADRNPVMTLTKNTTAEELQTAIRSDLSTWNADKNQADGRKLDLTNIRVNVEGYFIAESNLEATLSVNGKLVIKDVVKGTSNTTDFSKSLVKEAFTEDVLLKKDNTAENKGVVTKIIEALDMTTSITKDTTAADIKAVVEAKLNNDDIIVDADKTTVKATEAEENATDKKGSLAIKLVLRQVSTNKILKQEYEISYPDAEAAAIFAKGKDAVNAEWVQAEAAKLKGEYTDSDKLKEELLKAANGLLTDEEKAKYQFTFLNNDFTATIPEATKEGAITVFKLSLVAVTNGSAGSDAYLTEKIELAGITLNAEIARQTITSTATDIPAIIAKDSFKVSNNTSASEILQAAESGVDSSRFTVAYQQVVFDKDGNPTSKTGADATADTEKGDYFVKKDATVNADGEVKAVFVVTEKNPAEGTSAATQEVTVTKAIVKLDQTDSQAYAAAKAAIEKLDAEELTKEKVIKAAEDAVKSGVYTIDGSKLTFTAASATADGSVKGTISIKKGSNAIRTISVDKVVKAKPAPTPAT